MKRELAAALLIIVGTVTSGVRAEDADETARSAARALGKEGIALYDAGDFEGAVDRLGRAYAVVPAPTIGLWHARSLARVGRLVEASERYQEVIRTKLDAKASDAFKRARTTASRERAPLLDRIAKLVVRIEGAAPADVELTVNGRATESALVGVAIPIDPGSRQVEGRVGDQVVTETVELGEGGESEVTLVFQGTTESATAPKGSVAAPAPDAAASSRPIPVSAWIAGGVTTAALAGAIITGAVASSRKGTFDDANGQPGHDRAELESLRDDAHSMQTVNAVFTGAALLGAGVTVVLYVTRPVEERPVTPASAGAWVSRDGGGVSWRGSF